MKMTTEKSIKETQSLAQNKKGILALMASIELENLSCCVEIEEENSAQKGEIFFSRGKALFARFGQKMGQAAILEAMKLKNLRTRLKPYQKVETQNVFSPILLLIQDHTGLWMKQQAA